MHALVLPQSGSHIVRCFCSFMFSARSSRSPLSFSLFVSGCCAWVRIGLRAQALGVIFRSSRGCLLHRWRCHQLCAVDVAYPHPLSRGLLWAIVAIAHGAFSLPRSQRSVPLVVACEFAPHCCVPRAIWCESMPPARRAPLAVEAAVARFDRRPPASATVAQADGVAARGSLLGTDRSLGRSHLEGACDRSCA